MFVPQEWEEEKVVLEKIVGSFSVPAFHALDNAYYERATRFFRAAGPLWRQLSEDDFGARFILSEKEVNQYLSSVIRDSSYDES